MYHIVIAITDNVKDNLVAWLGSSTKVITIHNGVDVRKYAGPLHLHENNLTLQKKM